MDAHISPAAEAAMLIRRPVSEVFEAFSNPDVTTRFWFTKSNGRLTAGAKVAWEWEMYGVSADVAVREFEENRRIVLEWPGESGASRVEWTFETVDSGTFVTIRNSGIQGSFEAVVKEAIGSTEGFAMVLAGCKALLEQGIELNLVRDRFPEQ